MLDGALLEDDDLLDTLCHTMPCSGGAVPCCLELTTQSPTAFITLTPYSGRCSFPIAEDAVEELHTSVHALLRQWPGQTMAHTGTQTSPGILSTAALLAR
eukprot:scpid41639/ scgid19569/ 